MKKTDNNRLNILPLPILNKDFFVNSISITDKEFNLISTLVYERFGINLTEHKRTLVVSRLQKLLKSLNFKNFGSYYEYVQKDTSGHALLELINRISTNHTYFYREKAHFEFLKNKALPEIAKLLKKQNSRDLRIWCAGCSSGEEPYMLAMLMLEFFGNEYRLWDAGILATDISEKVLTLARDGIYPEERMTHLPPDLRFKYFRRTDNGMWTISDRVRQEVTFRRFNLMNEQFSFKKPFHIIFCRNVMIYFDETTRKELIRKFYQTSAPNSYLFIGHSETLGQNQYLYKYLMPAVYYNNGQ